MCQVVPYQLKGILSAEFRVHTTSCYHTVSFNLLWANLCLGNYRLKLILRCPLGVHRFIWDNDLVALSLEGP